MQLQLPSGISHSFKCIKSQSINQGRESVKRERSIEGIRLDSESDPRHYCSRNDYRIFVLIPVEQMNSYRLHCYNLQVTTVGLEVQKLLTTAMLLHRQIMLHWLPACPSPQEFLSFLQRLQSQAANVSRCFRAAAAAMLLLLLLLLPAACCNWP
jgi:hypothetical protein